MGQYRVYKKALNGETGEKWQKTSFVGREELIKEIIKELSCSTFYTYKMMLD